MNRKKNFIKNFIILTFGNAIPKLASIITLPIITGELSKAEFGTYDLIATVLVLILPLATMQLHVASFRFLMDDIDQNKKDAIVSNVIFTVAPLILITDIIVFLVMSKYSLLIRCLVFAHYGLNLLFRVFQHIVRGLHNNKLYSGAVAVNAIVNMIMVVVAVYFGKMGMTGALIALCVSDAVAFLILALKSKIFGMIHIKLVSMGVIKRLLQYSIPLIPNEIAAWVLAASDRFVLKIFVGIEATAVYAAATKIPTLLNMLQRSFAQAWQENASAANMDKDKETYYSEMFDSTFTMLSGFLALLVLSTPLLFRFLISGKYLDAYIHIPILFMGCFFACIAAYVEGIYIALKETKSVGITTAVCATVNIVIDLAMVNRTGIYAASVSTLVSFLLIAVYRMVNILKFQKINYKIPKIIIYTLFLTIMSGLCMAQNLYCDIINGVLGLAFVLISNGKTFLLILKKVTKAS